MKKLFTFAVAALFIARTAFAQDKTKAAPAKPAAKTEQKAECKDKADCKDMANCKDAASCHEGNKAKSCCKQPSKTATLRTAKKATAKS